jgi:hypothetical protein
LHRSVVRSAADANHRNKRVSFKPDVQEMINNLDVMPSNLPGNSHSKQKSKHKVRRQNNDVAHRTRSKSGHSQQNVGNRTRSKLRAICNSSVSEVFFPLYDVVTFGNHANCKNIDFFICEFLNLNVKYIIGRSMTKKISIQASYKWIL